MNLANQIMNSLRSGSIRDPRGSDAAGILASRLHKKKSEVIKVLNQLRAEGQIELEGSSDHCTQISVVRNFVPVSQEARRQQKYAVDQLGRGYKGVATGGPVIVIKSLEDWVNAGNDPSLYPFGTPETTSQDQQQATEPVAEQAPAIKPKRKQAKRVDSAPQRQRLEKIEKLKKLIVEEMSKTDDGHMLNKEFKLLAANQLSVSQASISFYMSELVKSGYIVFVKDKKYQGEMKFMLIGKMTRQDKLNAALDVLRKLKRKRNRRKLTEELSVALKITPKSAQTTILSNLKAIGAYSTKQDGNKFVIDFVQDHPVTDEQMEQLRLLRRSQATSMDATDDVSTNTEPSAPVVSESEVKVPAVAVIPAPVTRDEVNQLMQDLVEANEKLTDKLNHQTDVNSGLVATIRGQDERIIQLEMELEAERARSSQTISVKLDNDLLERARRVIGKEASSTES